MSRRSAIVVGVAGCHDGLLLWSGWLGVMTVCYCGRVVILICARWPPQVYYFTGGIPCIVPGGRLVFDGVSRVSLIEKNYDKEFNILVDYARLIVTVTDICMCICMCVCVYIYIYIYIYIHIHKCVLVMSAI